MNTERRSLRDSLVPSVRLRLQAGSRLLFKKGVLLGAGTAAAIIWAILHYDSYHHYIHGEPDGKVSFHFIVNEILMCSFFALATKEITESVLPGGALSSPRKAATPLLATLGGIVGPAALFGGLALYFGAQHVLDGWAIPCATDIAFSYLVARLIFGEKHPAIPFLLLLAIADDAAGLIILAIFYPQGEMHLTTFFICVLGAIFINIFIVKKTFKAKSYWWYLIVAGPLSWYGFHEGGIHPALALVPIIPTMPSAKTDVGLFAEANLPEKMRPKDALNNFEHAFERPVEGVLLCFGLANAGVMFSNMEGVTWFVTSGLLIGKPIGILALTLVAVKILPFELPQGMNFRDVLVLGCIAGIGFTVALFVSTVAFEPGPVQDAAKMGALFSFGAALVSFIAGRTLRVGRFSKQKEVQVPVPPCVVTNPAEEH